MSLYTQDVSVDTVILTDPEKAKALENDLRAKILDMLADEEMTISDMHDELDRRGEDKAETTVRHHVNVLQDAGLVELVRLEEAGGGTLKYYRSNTRMLSYELPEEAEEALEDMSETIRDELHEFIETVGSDRGDDIKGIAEEMKPCEHCSTQRYEEYILRELLNRALTDLSEENDLTELLD